MTPIEADVVRRKAGVIVANLKALEQVAEIDPAEYRKDIFLRKGTERLLQELIEAAIDVNTHIAVQEGKGTPDDYHHSFVLLGELGVLPPELAGSLAPYAGLRNRLVHRYADLDDALVLEAARKAGADFPRYVQAVENFLASR